MVGSLFACLLFACGDKGAVPYATGGAGAGGNTAGTGGAGAGGNTAGTGGAGAGGNTAGTGGAGGNTGASVSYSLQIVPLLQKSCSCHVTGGTSPLLDTYANVKATASTSDQQIADDLMPPGEPLSSTDKAIFQAWVTQGALNN
jgi:hypothetical protein